LEHLETEGQKMKNNNKQFYKKKSMICIKNYRKEIIKFPLDLDNINSKVIFNSPGTKNLKNNILVQ
jgi:hypothetical protein